MKYKRIIARLDIKGPNLVKGIHLEGLRVLGNPETYAEHYFKQGVDELIYRVADGSTYLKEKGFVYILCSFSLQNRLVSSSRRRGKLSWDIASAHETLLLLIGFCEKMKLVRGPPKFTETCDFVSIMVCRNFD